MSWDAMVLAGGQARRLGGVDKMGAEVGGRTLLERVVAAVAHADGVVLVGPRRPLAAPLGRSPTWTREQPPGGGPVAGLAAGLPFVTADRVAVLAGDLPFVTPALVDALLAAVGAGDGALLGDADVVPQVLCGAWRTAALRAAVAGLATPAGTSMRRLVTGLRVRVVAVPPDAGPPPWLDCDTAADLETARNWPQRPAGAGFLVAEPDHGFGEGFDVGE